MSAAVPASLSSEANEEEKKGLEPILSQAVKALRQYGEEGKEGEEGGGGSGGSKVVDDWIERNKASRILLDDLAERVKKNLRDPRIDRELEKGRLLASLASTISRSSSSIDQLCKVKKEDYDAHKMISWGRLRLSCFTLLAHLVSSEKRCLLILPTVVDPMLDMLRSASAKTDFAGVRIACNIVRNLSLSRANHQGLWRKGTFEAILKHADHKDPNTSLAAAICARQLSRQCEDYVANDAPPSFETVTENLSRILKKDMKHVHPIVRVELSRAFASLLVSCAASRKCFEARNPEDMPTTAPWTKKVKPALLILTSHDSLEFICFLLASNAPPLHAEALAALKTAFLENTADAKMQRTDENFLSFLATMRVAVNDVEMTVRERFEGIQKLQKAAMGGR